MSIEISCDNCQKRYRVKAELAGKRVRCANCGSPVTVPGGAGHNADAPPLDEQFMSEIPQAPVPRKPAPPKAAPPPVPRQVVRFDPRFDPQASDHPAPPPPAAPKPKPAPQRTPQAAPQPTARNDEGREIRFADDDPLFMSKPKPPTYDNLADTAAAAPAISGDAPEPRLDHEPTIPRGKRGSGKLADTASPPPSDEPDLDIAAERPIFTTSAESTSTKRIRAEQAAGKERKCTGCGAPMKVGAVICLNCGFNTATGERGAGAEWDAGEEAPSSGFSKYFGTREWRPEDRFLRKLAIFGIIVCLFPLIGLKVPLLVKPGFYIAFAGLAFGWIAAGCFAKRMQFTRAIVAAIAVVIAFAVYSQFKPVESDILFAEKDDTPKNVTPRPNKSNDPKIIKSAPGTDAASGEVLAILKGPAEGIDPINWYLSYLPHPDARVRFKSANYLISNTPPGRKEEVARAFEARLTDEHAQMRRLAIKGVALYIDDHTTSVLTPLLKDDEEEVRTDAYQLLAKLKDARALPAIVARMSDDGPLARETLAAFDASQKPAITRAFEMSLKNDNPRQRELAARELATWGGPNTPGLLLGLLDDGDVSVRCAALVTLGKLKDPRTLDAILNRLTYDRAAGVAALEAFGSGAEKPVLALLTTSASTEMRIAAAQILGSIGTKESIPALHDAAVDNDLHLAAAAKEAWRKIDPDFTASAESLLDMESEQTSRQRAGLQHLAELKPDKTQDRVSKMLVRMATSADANVREDTYAALPIWGTKDTVTAFIDMLTEKQNPNRRQLAETALGFLKDPRGASAVARWAVIDNPTAIDALAEMGPVAEEPVIELLMNDRLDIRRQAVKALKIWGSKQKALPALIALLQRDRTLDRGTLERDILEAIQAIKERPNLPRKPLPQLPKSQTQPAN